MPINISLECVWVVNCPAKKSHLVKTATPDQSARVPAKSRLSSWPKLNLLLLPPGSHLCGFSGTLERMHDDFEILNPTKRTQSEFNAIMLNGCCTTSAHHTKRMVRYRFCAT